MSFAGIPNNSVSLQGKQANVGSYQSRNIPSRHFHFLKPTGIKGSWVRCSGGGTKPSGLIDLVRIKRVSKQ